MQIIDALASLERTWSGLRRFDAVIPAGGGAVVPGELLRSALAAKRAAMSHAKMKGEVHIQ